MLRRPFIFDLTYRRGLVVLMLSISVTVLAQQAVPVSGIVHTPDVDLAYEVYGVAQSATAVIAVNGGPGLSHKYMLQNDVWERLSQKRQIVFYDQRGTGKPQHMKPDAPQGIAAQVADLEAAGIGDIGYVPKVGEAVSKATSDIDLTAQLPKFVLPTLIITGRYDMNVAPLTAWKNTRRSPAQSL